MKRPNRPPVYPLAPVLLALIAVSVLWVSYWGSEVSALGVFAIPVVVVLSPRSFRPPKDWSNRGQMSRIILSVLRQAAEPLTTRDIALQLLVERALDKSDQRLLRLIGHHR